MLALPPETADSRPPLRFQDRHHQRGALHLGWLSVPYGQQRRIGDAFNKAIAKRIRGDAEGTDVIFESDAFDDIGMGGSRLDERSAERLNKAASVEVAGPMFGDLARTAGYDVLVAFAATLRVVSWAKTVRIRLDFLKDESIVIKGTQRHDRVLIDLLERWTLLVEAVGEVVETSRCFGNFEAGWNFAPGVLKGSGRTLEVGSAPGTEAFPMGFVALAKLAIEREGDGRDEDGGNTERQEGNMGVFHGACS